MMHQSVISYKPESFGSGVSRRAPPVDPLTDGPLSIILSSYLGKEVLMNKAEIIGAIANAAGINKAQAGKALDAFTTAVTKSLKKGDKVTLVGFGTFSRGTRNARTGRNPKTGKPIKIAKKNVAKFKPGKSLADHIK
jgi:DNA-binding protein HU-beta